MNRGILVALEGVDGAGKGVVARHLTAALTSLGHNVVATAEPSTGAVGVLLRRALRDPSVVDSTAMASLFAADRADHVARVIAPALQRGDHVVCDRYELSNIVHRVADERDALPIFVCVGDCIGDEDGDGSFGDDYETACPRCGCDTWRINEAVHDRVAWASSLLMPPPPMPDITIVLDVPVDVGEARRAARGDAAEAYDAPAIQRRVRSLYRVAASLLPDDARVVVVSAVGAPHDVAAVVLGHVRSVIDERMRA